MNEGKLTFANGGPVVEYAIQMRKLHPRYFLPRLLRRNKVRRAQVNRIVSALKKFYEAQTPTAAITRWGSIEKLKDQHQRKLPADRKVYRKLNLATGL